MGDTNWVVPHRFMAFMGPDENIEIPKDVKIWGVKDYAK